MDRITFPDLVARSAQGALSADDIRSAFELDPARTTAFDPQFRINDAAVDVTGFEQTAAAAGHTLAIEAARTVAGRSPSAAGPAPDGTFVAEGDSWFKLPPVLYPPTMIDVLGARWPITNLAHWGDTLAAMVAAKQYVPFLRSGRLKALMISGGGDDLLGDTLEQSLRFYDAGHHAAADAAWYLTDAFHAELNGVMTNYAVLAEQVRTLSAGTILVVHGYDYARPQQNGSFLGLHFQRRGLEPLDHPDLVLAIVKVMVDLFNRRLQAFAAQFRFVRYVDLRGTLGPGDFYDGELHPTAAGATRLAAKLGTALPAPVSAEAPPLVA